MNEQAALTADGAHGGGVMFKLFAAVFAIVFAAERLRAIFDERQLVLLADFLNRLEIAGISREMHGDDRFGALGDARLNRLRRKAVVRAS